MNAPFNPSNKGKKLMLKLSPWKIKNRPESCVDKAFKFVVCKVVLFASRRFAAAAAPVSFITRPWII